MTQLSRRTFLYAASAGALSAGSAATGYRMMPSVPEITDRVSRYVAWYDLQLTAVVAEEHYSQAMTGQRQFWIDEGIGSVERCEMRVEFARLTGSFRFSVLSSAPEAATSPANVVTSVQRGVSRGESPWTLGACNHERPGEARAGGRTSPWRGHVFELPPTYRAGSGSRQAGARFPATRSRPSRGDRGTPSPGRSARAPRARPCRFA